MVSVIGTIHGHTTNGMSIWAHQIYLHLQDTEDPADTIATIVSGTDMVTTTHGYIATVV